MYPNHSEQSRCESSSSSSSAARTVSQGYDVFLSFKGEDTRTGFISHLYQGLTRIHITTYIDDKTLDIGNVIAPELLGAIEASRFAIVVLSSDYVTSKWCLEEIVKVVDCFERGKLIVIPVFYHVSPSDVRHQTGCFEQGFVNHEGNPEITPQKVEKWRSAFAKVGDISGLHITEHRNEAEVIDEIVKKVLKDLPLDTLSIDLNSLVGIKSRADEVKRILKMDSSEVLFIGICGMSGIGKTTLAEAVYKEIQYKFQKSSFLENIKDISKQNGTTDLRSLQQKLLDDTLEKSIPVQSVSHGKTLLGTKLRCFKVLLVLDDVNHVDQLTYLAGGREWFGPGSRIIVTTTNRGLLNPHKVNKIYKCEEMQGDEALRLFCQSAFNQGQPTHGYEKLSDDIVELAGGLPLALNVYGSLLCGKKENYWIDMIMKLRECSNEEVLGRLEVVYARLESFQQKTFIYIACFLKGRSQNLVEDILKNIGLYPVCGISDLKDKFLITINLDDSVWVHDLLQQMCWEVLRKEREKYNGKHIAIKYCKDIEDIFLVKPEGMRTIEIINQEPYKVGGADFYIDHSCFSKMVKLKFLRISKIGFDQSLDHISSDLRILEWYGCSLKSLPSTFEPKHIFELEMCCSQLETLWEKDLYMPNLRSINLSFSKDLIKIPDLTFTLNLEKLNLEGCANLIELHESVLTRKKLRYMNLKGCTHLRSLGRSIMEMEALEALHLSGCSKLKYIPRFGQNMKRLQHLYVDGTSITELPDNLGQMHDLRNLNASGTSIEELQSSFHNLRKLRILHIHRCPHLSITRGFLNTNLGTLSSGLRELDLSYCHLSMVPDGIGLLYCLITLDLSGNDFDSLPASIGLLSKLRMLSLNNCKMLQSLPKLSLLDEDLDYGPRSRFNFCLSKQGIDVSKYHASSNNTDPTVSCLNCPKLAENGIGSSQTDKILNTYLQLRSSYWMTPAAVFEIVGAGSTIPSRFKLLTSDGSMILEGPWVGVTICAVFTIGNDDAYMEAKYMINVHIHVGEKDWNIRVPINYLVTGSVNQLVLYWTVADDFLRILDTKRKNCNFSINVEPGDGKLQVTKFGVDFIRHADILQLKQHEGATSQVVKHLFEATLFLPTDLQWYLRACDADTKLPTCLLNIHDPVTSIIKFILDYGSQQDSLDGIHKIMKCMFELSQQVFNEYKEEWRHWWLSPLVYDYYRICHGTFELYKDFVRLLKDISGNWFCVKVVLEQNMEKFRAGGYTYKEMLQQLNDIETASSVRLSDNFLILFAYICQKTVAFTRNLNKQIQGFNGFKSLEVMEKTIAPIEKFKLLKIMVKVSSITIAGSLTVVAKYMDDKELLQAMKDTSQHSMWLHLMQSFSRKIRFILNHRSMKANFRRDLHISDLYSNAHLLKKLKKKIARFNFVTNENDEQVIIIINELANKISNFLVTVNDIRSDVQKFSLDIRKAGISLSPFISGCNLHAIKFGVCFIRDKETQLLKRAKGYASQVMKVLYRAPQLKRDIDYSSQVMKVLYRANSSLPDDLPWYVCACGAVTGLHSCQSIIHDHTSSQIKLFVEYGKQQHSLDGIRKYFDCLYEVYQNTLLVTSGSREDWRYLFEAAFTFFLEFMRLLKDISDSWLSVKLALEQIVKKSRGKNPTHEEMERQLNEANQGVGLTSYKFGILVLRVCERIPHICIKDTDMVKLMWVLVAGMLGVLAICMTDSHLMEELSGITPNSHLLYLLKRYSAKDGRHWFNKNGNLIRRHSRNELQIWDFYGDAIVGVLKANMARSKLFTQEIEEEMVILINKLQMQIDYFSNTIEHMHTDANRYFGDITRSFHDVGEH